MVNKEVNKDLVKERKNATFEILELTNFLDGNKEKTSRRKELGNYLFSFLYFYSLTFILSFILKHDFITIAMEGKYSEILFQYSVLFH